MIDFLMHWGLLAGEIAYVAFALLVWKWLRDTRRKRP